MFGKCSESSSVQKVSWLLIKYCIYKVRSQTGLYEPYDECGTLWEHTYISMCMCDTLATFPCYWGLTGWCCSTQNIDIKEFIVRIDFSCPVLPDSLVSLVMSILRWCYLCHSNIASKLRGESGRGFLWVLPQLIVDYKWLVGVSQSVTERRACDTLAISPVWSVTCLWPSGLQPPATPAG